MLSWSTVKHFVTGILLMSVVVGLGACSDDGDERVAPPTTTAPATTAPSDEDQIRTVVEDWYDVRVDALISGTLDVDRAGDAMTEDQLQGVEQALSDRTSSGSGTRRPDDDPSSSEIISVTVSGRRATVLECSVDGLVQYDLDTGDVIDDSVSTATREITVVKEGDRWLVDGAVLSNEVEGEQSCSDE